LGRFVRVEKLSPRHGWPSCRYREQRRRVPILCDGHTRIRPSLLRHAAGFSSLENRRAPIVEGYYRLSTVAVSDFRSWKKLMIQSWSRVAQTNEWPEIWDGPRTGF